ncbi:class I SAM-dependent DNA methyltransferase [Actinomadura rayongensis]|uniref:Methyltransferase domain-containing protein n=1 Tax=Actinomadura rayongensis TaxID=1429076 RepID=A0A6I4W5W1_9ACTN|nr:class I SAM-dependent methyltransferase [Actinomadura rayongensis]MXQ62534.1 methyltransferase domain-containing protein [Actinomadura rayongensis]
MDEYDAIADAYAARHLDALDRRPLDRALVDLVAAEAGELGPVADLGCGPGQAARRLSSLGATSLGVDSSRRMVEIASAAHPGVGFHVGDLRRLDVPSQAWGGIVCLSAVIHLPARELRAVFEEFGRVVKPSGVVLLSYLSGSGSLTSTFHGVEMTFHLHTRAEIETALSKAGFVPSAYVERRAYPDEVDTPCAHVMAHRAS